MNKNQVIALIIIAIVSLRLWRITRAKQRREGLMNYDECRAAGYTKEFCSATPTSRFGPSNCLCPEGRVGRIIPGFRGECVCDYIQYTYPYAGMMLAD